MRLQKVNLSMSHNVTISLLTQIGDGHDSKVFEWRDSLIKTLEIKAGCIFLLFSNITNLLLTHRMSKRLMILKLLRSH